MVYIHWITGTASLGRVFGRMELLTMVIVLGESQFSTQILLKIKQFEKMKLFPVLDVLIFKLGPLLLFYNEGVDDLVDCERMRKLDGNILPCIPSFKMAGGPQMYLTCTRVKQPEEPRRLKTEETSFGKTLL